MIQVFDDVITEEEQDLIYKELISGHFPWYIPANGLATTTFSEDTDKRDKNIFEDNHFVHTFMWEGSWTGTNPAHREIVTYTFSRLLNHLKLSKGELCRAKVNIQNKTYKKGKYNTPHVDGFGDHYVALYYACDSDGDTHIFETTEYPWKIKKTISPKKGRFVVFDGKYYHAGCHPRKNNVRIVINYNFLK